MPRRMNPTTCTAWMRQRDDDGSPAGVSYRMLPTNSFIQRNGAEKSIDRQTSNGNNHSWTNDPQLIVEPTRTLRALGGRWNAISATTWMRARKAARDR